jgi:hypothetical protein
MPREKKYTRTIAFRVTEEEWELLLEDMAYKSHPRPSSWVRAELKPVFDMIKLVKAEDAKRAEAKAKRAAKKQANNAPA